MREKLKTTICWAPLVTVTVMGLCFLTELVTGWLGVKLPPQPSLTTLHNSRGLQLAVNLAIILVLAPIIEEGIFRGLFYRLPVRLLPQSGRRVTGPLFVLVSAGLFTAAHYLQMPFPDNAFLALFAMGTLQCRIYEKTDTLWCPICVHAFFNGVNAAILFLFPKLAY